MSNVILKINNVDRSEYFVGPVRVNPGGDGVIGSATIYLRQEAGGLDIRTMDLVQLWVPFNTTTNAGIAAKGRLFGGHVMKRATTNVGTTKLWTLSCADFNVILKRSYRRASTVNAVTLVADTLDNQIQELFDILQGPTSVQIDVVSGVALTTAMPAVSYPGGHKWEWYLQSLLRQAHIEDPAVFPAYYMGMGTTFGALDTFGPPMLNVYDAASPPASVVAFSDTPTGAEKSVFEYLTRDTDATALGQTQQSWYRGLVFSASDTASITAYPNIYDDSGTGWVDSEVINDTTSGSDAEALAAVEALVRAKGAPRDGFKWVTYERLIPGEYVDLKWDLEGIPSMTQYRVAAATFEWEEPNVIKTTLTINTRRLGLFDDGTTGFFAPPIEGDNVPPLPAADFTVASNVYNQATGEADVTFDIDNTGGSPDTAGYKIIGGPTSAEPETVDVGLNLAPLFSLLPGISYSYRVVAYDNSGNQSETFPAPADPPLTFTTASIFIEPPTAFQIDATKGEVPNGYDWVDGFYAYPYFKWTAAAIQPDTYLVSVWLTSTPVGTRRDFTVPGSTVDMRWPFTQRVGQNWTGQVVAMVGTAPSTAASTTFTVPAYVPAPPTGLQIDTTKGDVPNGYVWPTDYTVYAWLKWTAPVPPPTPADPTNYRLTIYPTGFPAQAVSRNLNPSPLFYLWTGPLYVGTAYTAEITAWRNGLPSTAATTTFTPPVWPGGVAPVIGSVSHGVDTAGVYYLRIPLSHAGDHSGGGHIDISQVGGFERNQDIPRNQVWPYDAIVKGFVPEVLYTIEVYVFDAQMRRSPSDTDTYTIHAVPGSDRLHPGWDSYNPAYDPDERGLEDVDTDGTYLFDDTVAYDGNSTLKLTTAAGTVSVLLPEHHGLQEDEEKAISVAVQGIVGAAATASVQWVYFDDTDTEIGSRDFVYNTTPSNTFTLVDFKTSPAPATVKYARLFIAAIQGGSPEDVWFSRPIVSPQVPSAGIKDGAVIGAHIAPTLTLTDQTISLTSTAKIEGGGGFASIDASGIKIQGDGSGDNNIDFYNEVGVKGGNISSRGASGNFGLDITAFYNGAGSTDVTIGTVDNFAVSVSDANTLFQITSSNTTLDTGASTRPIHLSQGSVVTGAGVTGASTDGFLHIPAHNSAPSATPTEYGNPCPIYFDTGTDILWIYNTRNNAWVSIQLA